MKLSALLFTSAFALRVASLTLGPECLGLESSGLVERVEGTACYTKCESQDDCDPDSSCPNCACGWCKPQPPKKRSSEIAEAPALVKMGAMLDCGIPCTSSAECAGCTNWCQTTENGGICHPHLKDRAEPKPASLMKKEAEICYGHCGSDDDCPSECAYCWPTRVGGSCRLTPPPTEVITAKLEKKAEEPISKKDNISALFKKAALAACGESCETSPCADPCHCIGSICGQRPKEAREEASPLVKKQDGCGAPCSDQADCFAAGCGRCIGGKCGYGP